MRLTIKAKLIIVVVATVALWGFSTYLGLKRLYEAQAAYTRAMDIDVEHLLEIDQLIVVKKDVRNAVARVLLTPADAPLSVVQDRTSKVITLAGQVDDLIRALLDGTTDPDLINKMKEFKEAMIDPFQNIRDYITDRVSFPIAFLTYNWNKILCNLPSAYLSKNMKYRSLMSPLSKLNAIEIREGQLGENPKANVRYGLYCACCKQFITNSDGFTASISKLVDLLQIAPDVHYGTYCIFREKLRTKTTTLHLSQPTPLCVLILQNMKS